MLSTSLILAFSGIVFASAIPASNVQRDVMDSLTVTYWQKGCGNSAGQVSTNEVNETEEGKDRPGDCVLNINYGWPSVQISQPPNGRDKYIVDLFSGEGCNNPIITVTENGCYTQPNGQMVASFRARKA